MIQKPKDKTWYDEKGISVPITRVSALEKKKERYAGNLSDYAMDLNAQLIEFKQQMQSLSEEIYNDHMAKYLNEVKAKGEEPKKQKGNFTWYSFDRSVKIEVDVNDRIEFDSLIISACQEKLNDFLSDNLTSNQEYFRDLINDAFSTSHGKLDTRKVLGLLKHKSKIRQKKFQDAMALLEQSIHSNSSKTYYKVSVKDAAGEYKSINLNFSSL